MKTCVFCQIAKYKLPAEIIYQEDDIIAFLDANPKEAGHTLVIPKQHFSNLLEIPADLLADTIRVTQKVARLINQKLKPDGLNIYQNNGSIAGQAVDHFHFHIVPRYQKEPPAEKENLQAIAKILTRNAE